jgi:hypothetical protein
MKKTKIAYWIVTILFAGFMLFSAIPDLMGKPDAIAFVTHLGYPEYFVYFISVAKILGALAILVPGFPRIKEWAYAGLTFDLVGATYSFIALKYPVSGWAPMLIFIGLGLASYFLYHAANKAAITATA